MEFEKHFQRQVNLRKAANIPIKYKIDFISGEDKVIREMVSKRKSRTVKALNQGLQRSLKGKLPIRASKINFRMEEMPNKQKKKRRPKVDNKKLKRIHRRIQSKHESTIIKNNNITQKSEDPTAIDINIQDMPMLGYEEICDQINQKIKNITYRETERFDEIEFLNILVMNKQL